MDKFRLVCSECGSSDVLVDAWVRWNEETQDWEVANTFQQTFCESCEGESGVTQEPIDRP